MDIDNAFAHKTDTRPCQMSHDYIDSVRVAKFRIDNTFTMWMMYYANGRIHHEYLLSFFISAIRPFVNYSTLQRFVKNR